MLLRRLFGKTSAILVGLGATKVLSDPIQSRVESRSVDDAELLSASSGVVWEARELLNNGQWINACDMAKILDVAVNDGSTWSMAPDHKNCNKASYVPSGYLGVSVSGYGGGGFCGAAGPFYSSGSTYGIGWQGQLCANPPGLQSFRTFTGSRFYRGPSYPYNGGYILYGEFSPYQSY